MVDPAPHHAAQRASSVKKRNTVFGGAPIVTVRSSVCGKAAVVVISFSFFLFAAVRGATVRARRPASTATERRPTGVRGSRASARELRGGRDRSETGVRRGTRGGPHPRARAAAGRRRRR